MRRLLMPLLALLLAAPAPPDRSVDLGEIRPLLDGASESTPIDLFLRLPELAVGLDERQIDGLIWVLRHGSKPQRLLAAELITYAGEPRAARVLLRRSLWTGEEELARLASMAAGALSSQPTRDLLVAQLAGEQIGATWGSVMESALSLGVRRERAAVPALREAAGRVPESFGADAARLALSWIEGGEGRVAFAETTDELEVLAAVFRLGLPRTYDRPQLYEAASERLWSVENGEWSFSHTAVRPQRTPRLDFKVRISPEQERAIVSAALNLEGHCGTGWDYVLRRRAGRWQVVGFWMIWIS